MQRFPPGFLWGTATAAHQVEGGNRWNDWWEYEERGRVPYRSGDACRHYDRFEQDFDLARSLGQNAHRFSIEWSRIEPEEGRWNPVAAAHYARVVRALRDRGLEPIVTLHHFTTPAWFLRRGGWARQDSPALFERYIEYLLGHLEPAAVTYWLTLNEPTVYAMQGYILGEWPPCRSGAWLAAGRVLINLARAHVAAYRLLHRRVPGARVGFAHSAPVVQPCDPARRRDRFAAAVRDAILNRGFFRLIGASPGRPTHLDVIGLNYYTRTIVRGSGFGAGTLFGRACRLPHHGDDGPASMMGWEVYPIGLRATLERFAGYGVPLLIAENGIATDHDEMRRSFIKQHLEVLARAIEAGCPVIGYCYWSLLDNFEWALGTTARFGLASVDATTQERRVKPSGRDFAEICRANRLGARARAHPRPD